jgi:hypothetical protein
LIANVMVTFLLNLFIGRSFDQTAPNFTSWSWRHMNTQSTLCKSIRGKGKARDWAKQSTAMSVPWIVRLVDLMTNEGRRGIESDGTGGVFLQLLVCVTPPIPFTIEVYGSQTPGHLCTPTCSHDKCWPIIFFTRPSLGQWLDDLWM